MQQSGAGGGGQSHLDMLKELQALRAMQANHDKEMQAIAISQI